MIPLCASTPLHREKSSVRLACVKHAASVHPEPGSNSHVKSFNPNLAHAWLNIHNIYCKVLFFSELFSYAFSQLRNLRFLSHRHSPIVPKNVLTLPCKHARSSPFRSVLLKSSLNVQGCIAVYLSRSENRLKTVFLPRAFHTRLYYTNTLINPCQREN